MKVLIGKDDIFLNSDIILNSDIQLMGRNKAIYRDSIEIEDAIEERSTASFIIVDIKAYQRYTKGMPVKIMDDDEEEILFAGIIESVVEKKIGPSGGLFHSITCIDYHYLADKRVIARAYQEMRAGDIVLDIIENYLEEEGVVAGNIQLGEVVLEATFNYIPVSDAIGSLAEKTGFWWNIDHNKKLNFVARHTNVAPFNVSESDMRKGTVHVEKGNQQYRNKQYVKGGKDITDPQTQTFLGDGENQTFTVAFPVAKVPTVEINTGAEWVAQSIGIRGLEQEKQWYWSKGDNTITQELQSTPLAPTERIRITYQGEFSIVAITFDSSEIENRKTIEETGTGLVEDVIDDKSIASRESAFELANSKIKKYCNINRKVKFTTSKKGLMPGQILTVSLPIHEINDIDLLIDKVTITTEGNIVWYQIEAVEGPASESWAKLFYNMAAQRREFVIKENIQENQILITLEQFSKTWEETESPNIFQGTYAGDTTFPSNNLYPMFNIPDRVKYLAWYFEGLEVGRKTLTRRVDSIDQIFSITLVNALEANGNISHLAWIGGIEATEEVGTGIEIDKQEFVKTKTDLEAIQVEKTEQLNFMPRTGELEITPVFLNSREETINQLHVLAENRINQVGTFIQKRINDLITKST